MREITQHERDELESLARAIEVAIEEAGVRRREAEEASQRSIAAGREIQGAIEAFSGRLRAASEAARSDSPAITVGDYLYVAGSPEIGPQFTRHQVVKTAAPTPAE